MMKIRVFTLLSLASAAILMSACNTLEGAGKDLQEAGEAIQNTVN